MPTSAFIVAKKFNTVKIENDKKQDAAAYKGAAIGFIFPIVVGLVFNASDLYRAPIVVLPVIYLGGIIGLVTGLLVGWLVKLKVASRQAVQ